MKTLSNLYEILKYKIEVKFVIGSSTITHARINPENIEGDIITLLKHYLFDIDFYYNWTDSDTEYIRYFYLTLLPEMLNNISEYIIYENDTISFNPKIDKRKFITDSIMNSNELSRSIKDDYREYMKKYFGKII